MPEQHAQSPTPLTPAHEDYLKAIYVLDAEGARVTNSALADYLSVTPASATNMVKRLAELNLVEYAPYQQTTLTEAGRLIALEVLRHHRLIELYLHKALGIPWDRVHEEAEKLEHVLSESVEDAMARALGNPTVDPHGDPIPSKAGHVAQTSGLSLLDAEADVPYRLVRVLFQDQERLHHLGTLGLYLNAEVVIRSHAAPKTEESLAIEVNGEPQQIARETARALLIQPLEKPNS